MIDLKAWRTGHGMTPHQAAGALGIGDSTVRAIEAGTRKMTVTLSLACHGWDATHCDEWPAQQTAPANEMWAQLYEKRLAAAERDARIALQRSQEACMAIEDAGLPIHQQIIPMTDEEAEEAELKLLKAQRIEEMQRAATAAPGALTDEERAESERARRAIAKARTLAAGEPWE